MTLTVRDNGREICLAVGQTLKVVLPATGWSAVKVTGPALTEVNSATYRGAAPGRVQMSSTGRGCPPADGSGGTVNCFAILTWRVMVDVR
ncbi:hypothetical protein QMK19_29370 [Streptomyces sp. H10-C2]|uniref:hypothetical protein n=1 Tax=unclassified Streptomyces TaxID=2593676 RepID=UPI0024BAE11A|nr:MULTISPECIES: hypothetical protein [unclassified Streptomyces]MDJ0344292.1 hypothetical protein [Streptomyces sp. PH10-H1]MDJ0373661.1 hypothetical protein [Streptomyces sp. H10-C2]